MATLQLCVRLTRQPKPQEVRRLYYHGKKGRTSKHWRAKEHWRATKHYGSKSNPVVGRHEPYRTTVSELEVWPRRE